MLVNVSELNIVVSLGVMSISVSFSSTVSSSISSCLSVFSNGNASSSKEKTSSSSPENIFFCFISLFFVGVDINEFNDVWTVSLELGSIDLMCSMFSISALSICLTAAVLPFFIASSFDFANISFVVLSI